MASERSAADAFRLLSDETRLAILRTVAAGQRDEFETGVAQLSFSDIYERVDMDDTSRLSYHLGELTGTFLRKHEGGYAFTHAGEQLIRFVLAENFRRPTDFGPVGTDGRCLHCGESALHATLQEQYFVVECGACDGPAFSYRVRPAQVRSHDGDDLIDAVAREQAADFLKMRRGICPDCAGRVETEVFDAWDAPVPDGVPASFGTLSECEQCLRVVSVPLPHAAAYHPESISFHWERGVDVLGTGAWEFHRYLHDDRWTAERVGSQEYLVELACGADSLRLLLDDTAAVTRTERVERRDHRDSPSR